MITRSAPARVGILGNPSDGYGGKTLGLAVPELTATVSLQPGGGIRIAPGADDATRWSSTAAFVDRIDRFGYGSGTQLLAAAVRTFIDVADSVGTAPPDGFELTYNTTIPRQVGLGGSSALVVAALGCLAEFVGLEIPEVVMPSIALRVETEQLGITAGLQDRVVQVYGGLVAMDFGTEEIDGHFGVSHGHYEQLDQTGLPPLFVAYRESAAEPSGAYHGQLRARFEAGDVVVRETMRSLAALVTEGRAALRWGNGEHIADLIDENMTLRTHLGPVPEDQLELVSIATSVEASATFAGSGGAVVGAYRDPDHLDLIRAAYATIGVDSVFAIGQIDESEAG